MAAVAAAIAASATRASLSISDSEAAISILLISSSKSSGSKSSRLADAGAGDDAGSACRDGGSVRKSNWSSGVGRGDGVLLPPGPLQTGGTLTPSEDVEPRGGSNGRPVDRVLGVTSSCCWSSSFESVDVNHRGIDEGLGSPDGGGDPRMEENEGRIREVKYRKYPSEYTYSGLLSPLKNSKDAKR